MDPIELARQSPSCLLSVVVVVFNMRREAPRTLYSLSPAYQRGVDSHEYEVIVVENGSNRPLECDLTSQFGANFRYFFLEDPPASPAYALNYGVRKAQGKLLGLMIDGARIVSPGMLRLAMTTLTAFRRPVVGSLAFHLGPGQQTESQERGYDRNEEDRLLASIAWKLDGYRLFEISSLAGSSAFGWFQPVAESNCVFLSRDLFEELDGFDERFVQRGGGLVNLDFYDRACALPNSHLVMLLGEATFHQFHGGVMTNSSTEDANTLWAEYNEEYRRLRGSHFRRPTRRPMLLGDVSVPVLERIRESCDLFWQSPNAPELHPRGGTSAPRRS